MEKKEYEVMFNIEDSFWWYVGLRKLVSSFIDKLSYKKNEMRILDAGCGTGKILEGCNVYNAYGLDYSDEALRFCKQRNSDNLIRGSISEIPFKNRTFDVVISLDVLYHRGIKDDRIALGETFRVLSKGGILLLNLPAYNFLRRRHDEAVHTERRYTIKDLKEKVEGAGFEIDRITYRNTLLFPLTVLIVLMEKIFSGNNEKMDSDLKPLPLFLNKILAGILFLENKLIISGLNLPFGLSVYCVARKN